MKPMLTKLLVFAAVAQFNFPLFFNVLTCVVSDEYGCMLYYNSITKAYEEPNGNKVPTPPSGGIPVPYVDFTPSQPVIRGDI
jgi:hypothetical protein